MVSQGTFFMGALILTGLVVTSKSKTFLGHSPTHLHGDLLQALELSLGAKHRESAQMRISLFEATLRSKFAAMPKNAQGTLGHMAVRYLLHRVFVERHGWYVVNLFAAGDNWDSASPTSFLEDDDGPSQLHSTFEEKLNTTGFSIHDVSVLAATLERLIHTEVVERLHKIYELGGISMETALSSQMMEQILDHYMVVSVLGGNYKNVDNQSLVEAHENIEAIYPSWPETRSFVREVKQNVLSTTKTFRNNGQGTYQFDAVERVVTEIGERYGQLQNLECQDLKKNLMDLEEGNTGRVPLSVFYRRALQGMWQFSERQDHLRQVGALDESNPHRPSVIIPNYVYSLSNCVAGSSFYDVCCIDECEALLGHIEDRIAAPDASPELIAMCVSELPSATVAAPQNLSAELIGRLHEIADHHHGTVLLHGRLFAQWLHHVYPRECPYPHPAGTTRPQTQEEWYEETGIDALASADELQVHLEELESLSSSVAGTADEQVNVESHCLPWLPEEELFTEGRKQPSYTSEEKHATSAKATWFRRLACTAAISSLGLMLWRVSSLCLPLGSAAKLSKETLM